MKSVFLVFAFLWALIKERPDRVFSSTLYINNKILLFRRLFPGTKFVTRCENYLYTFTEKQRKLIEWTYRYSDLIIAQTEEMEQELVDQMSFPKDKIAVMYNPIDKETIDAKLAHSENPYPANDAVRFCSCGKFAKQKGFDLLIDAFNRLKENLPNAELYLVGKNDGTNKEYADMVEDKIKKYGLSDSVHCVGFQTNPYKYIKHADCFVLSSRWEGLPNVMLEALYLGTPVAAFKCIPIIERIITDGTDGYLAEKEDVEDLAEAMLSAYKLGRITSSYKSAKIEDFHRIFEYGIKPES